MNTPAQEESPIVQEEESMSIRKIVVITITILTLVGVAAWQGILLALRLTS